MKYSSISYLIGEGFRNVFKNKKSTAASLIIMCMAMLIFGIFFILGENINHIMTTIEDAQGMQVYILTDVSEERVQEIGREIKALDGVNTMEFVSKEDALNQLKESFKDNASALDGIDKERLPASYIVTLTDLELNEQVQEKIMQIEGIDEINSSKPTITTLISLGKGIRIFTLALLIILVIISVSIITNTIKLTVHARRKEISIMKYVGATNNFIRWPFMIEGIVIGIIAAMIALLIVGVGYDLLAQKLMQAETVQTIGISLVTFSDMFNLIITIYLALGIGIGVIGSSISMRKYLEV